MQKDLMVSRVIQFPNTSHKLGIRHSANSNHFLAKKLVLQKQNKTKHTCTHKTFMPLEFSDTKYLILDSTFQRDKNFSF